MHTPFPTINEIADVLPIIADKTEFYVAEKYDYTGNKYLVVNYHVCFQQTFDDPNPYKRSVLRELRGIIFDGDTGEIIRRPYHKFFNLNECHDTRIENVDFSANHMMLDKLDGSMIAPFMITDDVMWGTKMGLTDTCKPVEAYVLKHPQYDTLAREIIIGGSTPIFEWCSQMNRIVIEYAVPKLVLTGVRNIKTGAYASHQQLVEIGTYYNVPVVDYIDAQGCEQTFDQLKSGEDVEGYVVRFADGHMIKVKTDWYCTLHKTKDYLTRERYLPPLIINGLADDIKPILFGEYATRFPIFEASLKQQIDLLVAKVISVADMVKQQHMDKKQYALNYMPHNLQVINTFIFNMLDGKKPVDPYTHISEYIVNMCNTQQQYDRLKKDCLAGLIPWIETTDEE